MPKVFSKLRGWLLMAVLCPLAGCVPGSSSPADPGPEVFPAGPCSVGPVATASGAVCGDALFTQVGDEARLVNAFLGIPYAETTAGENRWRAPVPKTPWQGNFPATAFGDICPQNPGQGFNLPQGEDCLSLNIWAPAEARGAPVMVFIYGGGFKEGSSALSIYDGAYLAAAENRIVVSLNYRLGALGFLAGVSGLSGNYGFLDQQLALRWVAENIEQFGGDSSEVTLFGESAGAMSAGLHLLSAPASQPLFKAAIMESNPFALPYKTLEQATLFGEIFQQQVGCSELLGSLACMRSVPLEQILAAEKSNELLYLIPFDGLRAMLAWTPVIDGEVLTAQPVAAAMGGHLDKPALLGTNRDEGILFIALGDDKPIGNLAYEAALAFLFGEANVGRILAEYPAQGGDNAAPMMQITTDYLFACSNRLVAETAQAGLYAYEFAQTPSFNFWPQAPECDGKVCHGAELPFVFHSASQLGQSFTPEEERLSQSMVRYWGNFASANHDPNGDGTDAPWPAFASPGQPYLILDTLISTGTPENNCAFWDGFGYDTATPHRWLEQPK